MSDKKPQLGGRPTKYKPAFNNQVYKLALLGATDVEIAAFFEISKATLNTWKKEFPRFLDSLKRGKTTADAKVAESLFKRAIGYSHPDVDIRVSGTRLFKTKIVKHYPPDTVAAIFWLKNRSKENWRDKSVMEFEHLSDDQLQEIVHQLTQKIK